MPCTASASCWAAMLPSTGRHWQALQATGMTVKSVLDMGKSWAVVTALPAPLLGTTCCKDSTACQHNTDSARQKGVPSGQSS